MKRFIQKTQPSLEAQLVNFADEIAYNHHDIDDGYRSGLVTFDQLKGLPFFNEISVEVKSESPSINEKQMIKSTIRRMMNIFIMDLCQYSQAQLDRENFNCIDDVRNAESHDWIIRRYGKKTTIFEAIFKRSTLPAPSSAGHDRQRQRCD